MSKKKKIKIFMNMDDVKIFVMNEKELQSHINCSNHQQRYKNGIWNYKLCNAYNK